MGFMKRFQNGWNAFRNRDPTDEYDYYSNLGSTSKPDRTYLTRGNEKSIVNALYTRMAIDISNIKLNHCEVDENRRFKTIKYSGLNNCLSVEANIDQTSNAFMQDVVMSLFDEGCVAIVPTETDADPNLTESYDIESMRVGKILEWYPNKIKTRVYNEKKGQKEDIVISKNFVAIIENPFYNIMNEPNSTLKRLIRKLNLLDVTDQNIASGKLDLIIGLPYPIKTQSRKKMAQDRAADIERQLSNSKYGIAYTDGTERITQLNRPVENNLMSQVDKLTSTLYDQLGIPPSVLNGTADEQTMLNYYGRVIDPIMTAITKECERKFLSKNARTRGQAILYFRDPFSLVPAEKIANISDTMTRNEILTSNEIRSIIGYKPSDDPKADELINSNLNHTSENETNNYNIEETEE